MRNVHEDHIVDLYPGDLSVSDSEAHKTDPNGALVCEEITDVSIKVKNEVLKKEKAIQSRNISSEQSGMKEVCLRVEQFREESFKLHE